MRFLFVTLSALHLGPAIAFPAQSVRAAKRGILEDSHFVLGLGLRDVTVREEKKDEIEIAGTFGTPVPLIGGKKKQDTAFKSVGTTHITEPHYGTYYSGWKLTICPDRRQVRSRVLGRHPSDPYSVGEQNARRRPEGLQATRAQFVQGQHGRGRRQADLWWY